VPSKRRKSSGKLNVDESSEKVNLDESPLLKNQSISESETEDIKPRKSNEKYSKESSSSMSFTSSNNNSCTSASAENSRIKSPQKAVNETDSKEEEPVVDQEVNQGIVYMYASVFTELENVRSEPTNRRSRTSDFLTHAAHTVTCIKRSPFSCPVIENNMN
jgi:hypothetical protein